MEQLSIARLCLLRCLLKGASKDLLAKVLERCGATQEDYATLEALGWVGDMDPHRVGVTLIGGREYRKHKKGRHF